METKQFSTQRSVKKLILDRKSTNFKFPTLEKTTSSLLLKQMANF